MSRKSLEAQDVAWERALRRELRRLKARDRAAKRARKEPETRAEPTMTWEEWAARASDQCQR
jgi:hypothetical protein